MAKIKKLDSSQINYPLRYFAASYSQMYDYNETAEWYLVDGGLTEEDVNKINSISGKHTVFILPNTKGQNSEIIRKINNPYVRISVTGGLDYLRKRKYNDSEYIDRTFYKPGNLARIIEVYEKIERQIRPTWTDTQKCMFVYKKIVEVMHYQYDYESDFENGQDVARSLHTLLAKRAVCAGFALLFKEAMDRLGIECLYQNKQHHHAWNVVKLEGEWRALDLTWDVNNKKNNQCGFAEFCMESGAKFYGNRHHNISRESEEIMPPIVPFTREKLQKDLATIMYKGLTRQYSTRLIGKYYIAQVGKVAFVTEGTEIRAIEVNQNDTIKDMHAKARVAFSNPALNVYDTSYKVYHRNDGTFFMLMPTGKQFKEANEYGLVSFSIKDKQMVTNVSTILSENTLVNWNDPNMEALIANSLLSQHRLARKMEHFNGYVGYIGAGGRMLYSADIEEGELNIQNRH